MAFGFAGAAAGASKSLEEIVADRLKRQMLEAEIADRQQRFSLDQDRLNEAKTQNAFERDQASKPKPDPLIEYEGKKKIDQQYEKPAVLKPERDPIADYRQRKTIDKEFEKPAAAPKPGVHVVGGNLVDDSGKVLFTDPNKAKTGANGEASPYSTERALRTVQSVDELMGKVGGNTAGYGSLLANLPATDARNFKAELDTLKANVAFNELTAMREASKTGGALGQISDRESQLLMSALGALDAGQSPENLKAQLQKVKASVQRWQAAQNGAATPAVSHDTGAPAAPKRMRFDRTGKPIP